MYAFPGQYMPRVGSWQASLNKLIWCALLCYLLCSGDKMAPFSKLRGHIQSTETRKVTLKGLKWVSVEICNEICALVIKMNKFPDETTIKEVTDYKQSKRKEDPLPQDHSPP